MTTMQAYLLAYDIIRLTHNLHILLGKDAWKLCDIMQFGLVC